MTKQNSSDFTITKRIAKHGSQAVIVVPKILQDKLSPGTIVKLSIDILDVADKIDDNKSVEVEK